MKLLPATQLSQVTGYTPGHIRCVLSGRRDPSLQCARELALALEVSLDSFIKYIDSVKPSVKRPINLCILEDK